MTRATRRAITGIMDDAPNTPPDGLRFDAVLVPHRSLPRRSCTLLVGSLALLLASVGFAFWSLGAWPVAGFCGLEALLVWGAFELSYRSGRTVETVRLDDRALRIDRIAPSGRTVFWTFEPGWVRVAVEPRRRDGNALVVASHGRRLAIGAFLTDGERRELAAALNEALARWRSAPGVFPYPE